MKKSNVNLLCDNLLPLQEKLKPKPKPEQKSKPKKKIRNYSFRNSKRLSDAKMTEANGIKIPSLPGSCYHAILSSLAEYKDQFCLWRRIIELTQKNMRMYGGEKAWNRFSNVNKAKSYEQRIKENAHTLTRMGRDCYGFRLHERGMCIYYFKDGAMLLTGGEFQKKGKGYNVLFSGGRHLQTRYRGTTMTYSEYKKFLDKGLIDNTGKILNVKKMKKFRSGLTDKDKETVDSNDAHVCVVLGDGFNQDTAIRLEKAGLIVEEAFSNELIGTVPKANVGLLQNDPDVAEVEISGE